MRGHSLDDEHDKYEQQNIPLNITGVTATLFTHIKQARTVAALLIAGAFLIPTPNASLARTPAEPAKLPARGATTLATATDTTARSLPNGAIELPCENVEGVILVPARIYGADRDTAGQLVVDTGAGFLGLGHDIAFWLGIDDRASDPNAIEYTKRPVRRLELGSLQLDQVTPVITLDHEVIRRVTDRDALGVIGQRPLRGRCVWIDYEESRVIIFPAARVKKGPPFLYVSEEPSDTQLHASLDSFRGLLTKAVVPIPFLLAGDGKMLVRVRLSGATASSSRNRKPNTETWSSWLTMIIDTGATKSVLFEPAVRDSVPDLARWRSVSGLVAPTLVGSANARVVLAPALEISGWWTPVNSTKGSSLPDVANKTANKIHLDDVDCASIETSLADVLSRAVEQRVFGLIGYSVLRHFRVGVDYENNILWLDPYDHEWDDRSNEYCHVGVQLERDDDAVRVVAVADGSPAAQAGIVRGDELVTIDGESTRGRDLNELARRLEGAAGSRVTLVVRHGSGERSRTLTRRCLL